MNEFQLHPQLAADTQCLGEFPLSLVLLANDCQYPWLILVPKRADIREIHHLSEADQQTLMCESCAVACLMESVLAAEKINVAALGNMVPQLHLHHVARFSTDAAWPAPIWGKHPAIVYANLGDEVALWQQRLSKVDGFTPEQCA
ncbi:HIT domain-containing protein [Oceanisphaera pacifica]|uniref:HIT domain-containing protein n=1 Tax=Oceanisphaera pacifica TaxID=2818389 RepID=A0ABS3NIF3_9GAMM|nr:HIT domain-containing protein [Oceanisphaera pacifica]MBO1520364.1 HIT domain-containing protein [Oceanisphaera pacifica]